MPEILLAGLGYFFPYLVVLIIYIFSYRISTMADINSIIKVIDILHFKAETRPPHLEIQMVNLSDFASLGISFKELSNIFELLKRKTCLNQLIGLTNLMGFNQKEIPNEVIMLTIKKENLLQYKNELLNSNIVKTPAKQTTKSDEITKMELLEDITKKRKITVFVNIQYDIPRVFSRRKYWGKMYELAESKTVDYNKSFYDYFNSNKKNPLYKKEGFKITKILTQDGDNIIPNIEIKIISQKKITTSLNQLNKA